MKTFIGYFFDSSYRTEIRDQWIKGERFKKWTCRLSIRDNLNEDRWFIPEMTQMGIMINDSSLSSHHER